MNEGVFRVLRALGDGTTVERDELVRRSGEALSVLRDVGGRHETWFEVTDGQWRCTETGLAALAREMVAREGRAAPDDVLQAFIDLCSGRGAPKRELDQFYATPDTALKRARLLVESGELQRGLAFLGDDDFTSLAVHLVGGERRTTVLDVDPDILNVLSERSTARNWEHQSVEHDLREPTPRKLQGRFGCVFADPPYAIEGFRLFVSRGIELLKPDGRLYVCFGQSRRASERGLQKQEALTEAGLLVEQVLPDFNHYHGAESIGSQSALWITRVTPKTKPLVRGAVDGSLYTSREPRA